MHVPIIYHHISQLYNKTLPIYLASRPRGSSIEDHHWKYFCDRVLNPQIQSTVYGHFGQSHDAEIHFCEFAISKDFTQTKILFHSRDAQKTLYAMLEAALDPTSNRGYGTCFEYYVKPVIHMPLLGVIDNSDIQLIINRFHNTD